MFALSLSLSKLPFALFLFLFSSIQPDLISLPHAPSTAFSLSLSTVALQIKHADTGQAPMGAPALLQVIWLAQFSSNRGHWWFIVCSGPSAAHLQDEPSLNTDPLKVYYQGDAESEAGKLELGRWEVLYHVISDI